MNPPDLCPVRRAEIRLQRLAATVTVDSLHVRRYRQAAVRNQAEEAAKKMSGAGALEVGVPRFAYTIVYVKDVGSAIDFYKKAFGVGIRRVDDSRRWAELETGATTLAFTPLDQREAGITGGIHAQTKEEKRGNVEIHFTYKDVDAAFKHAVEAGATPVAQPEPKEWGQKVGYVRDPDGVTIRLGSDFQT